MIFRQFSYADKSGNQYIAIDSNMFLKVQMPEICKNGVTGLGLRKGIGRGIAKI
jgi:hypothetical protein